MKVASTFVPKDIRNLVLLGHTAVGKTTLAEALVARTGGPPSNNRGAAPPTAAAMSTTSVVHFLTHEGKELNFIDTPGHPELVGQALAALPAVETAVVLVDAVAGVQLGARRLFEAAGELGLARMVVVNRIDQAPDGGLQALYAQLRAELGHTLHALNLPAKRATDVVDCFDLEAGEADFGSVADVHREMLESSVEIDDDEMEKYLSGEPIDLAEMRACFVKAMTVGHVVPVLFCSAKTGVGLDDLLHVIAQECPSPLDARPRRLMRGAEIVEVPCDVEQPFMAHVFRVTTDPQLGKVAMLRILQGHFDSGTMYVGHADKKARRAGAILKIEGRHHPEIDATAHAGDIVALARVEELHVDQVLHAPSITEDFAPIRPRYPQPMIALAIKPLDVKDDVKLAAALALLSEEDPTLAAAQDPETNELVLRGLGELHLRSTLDKLEERHRIRVSTSPPRVAYRETIAGRSEGHHRHKKQTGGAGQFGEVFLRVEPLPRGAGFEFVNATVGGVIPKQFMTSVEKGVQDALTAGPLTGSVMQDVRVTVYDGKTHPVDGKDVAFRTAGKKAFRDAVSRARPLVLEPIVTMDISVPEALTGTVTADLKNMRGRVVGVETSGAHTLVHALVPLAEIGSYAGQLRSSTGGAGAFTTELAGWEPVPPLVQKRLADAYKPPEEEEG
ncbi:MAG: elongation factor G [Deltaproteobacteria bacterium]|nr:elongation factor G [Deltaproteobacteria bacterium]